MESSKKEVGSRRWRKRPNPMRVHTPLASVMAGKDFTAGCGTDPAQASFKK